MEQLQIEEEPPAPAQAKPLPSSFSTFNKWIPLLCLAVLGAVLITVLVMSHNQKSVEEKKSAAQVGDGSSPSSSSSSRQPRSSPDGPHRLLGYHPSPPIIIAPIDPEAVQQELDGLREAIDDLRLNTSRLEAELTALKNANPPLTTPPPDTSEPDRLKAVQSLIITVWSRLFKRGDELKSVDTFTPLEAFSSLTTLELLPLSTKGRKPKRKQAEETRRWLADHFSLERIINFPTTEPVATFSTAYIGGLLSAYSMTKDEVLFKKAVKMADLLAADAHHPATGVPYQLYTFSNRSASGRSSTLSAVGGHHLEAVFLSALTKKPSYLELSQKTLNTIKETFSEDAKVKPLYNRLLSIDGLFAEYKVYTLFAETKDFFYGLLKAFIQSGGADEPSLEQYFEALEAVEAAGLLTTENSKQNLTWAREWDASLGQFSAWMAPSGCYLGGMFALTADVIKRSSMDFANVSTTSIRHPDRLMQLAKGITETCTLAANQTSTGLLPQGPFFPGMDYRSESGDGGGSFNLNPDLAENYLLLWRTTAEESYRDAAWQQVQALERLFSTKSEMLSKNVSLEVNENSNSVTSLSTQPIPSPLFLSATLKYLYLTFSDANYYPLNRWLFNSAGHLLPICGQHELFSQCQKEV